MDQCWSPQESWSLYPLMLRDNYTGMTVLESDGHTLQCVSSSLSGNILFCISGCLVPSSALVMSWKATNKQWLGFIEPPQSFRCRRSKRLLLGQKGYTPELHTFPIGPLPPAWYRESCPSPWRGAQPFNSSTSRFKFLLLPLNEWVAQGYLSSLNLSGLLTGLN